MNRQASSPDDISIEYSAIEFSEITGWEEDDFGDALCCYLQTARRMVARPYTRKTMGFGSHASLSTAKIALDKFTAPNSISYNAARLFFEENFTPVVLSQPEPGFVTGYYEPVLAASRSRSARFNFPLYRRPQDLVDLDDENRPKEMDPYFRFGYDGPEGIVPYMDRAAINLGGLAERGLELFWLEDPIEVFFLHIQGSARLLLDNGTSAFVSYDAKTGHRFTAIGKILVEEGQLDPKTISMNSIKGWLRDNPDRSQEIMEQNQSYIFFKEVNPDDVELGPIGAAAVQLSPKRSLAVDHKLHTFGTPVFVSSNMEIDGSSQYWAKLMIAQDTGSAIVGPKRGDLFIGSGETAGDIAGQIKAEAEFVFLKPNAVCEVAG